jgi:hypothetical protein
MPISYRSEDSNVLNQQLNVQELVVKASDTLVSISGNDLSIAINEPVNKVLSCIKESALGAISGFPCAVSGNNIIITNGAVAGDSNLGAASSFAALSATPVLSNTGSSVLSGDIGISPAASITGFPPGTFSGVQHIADGTAAAAQTALAARIVALQALGPGTNESGNVLGSGGTVPTLTPGVYSFTSTAQLTGALTLNGAGNYTFLVGSSLTTASGSSVILSGGATAANVNWVMGASATIGTTTAMVGNLLAHTSVTMNTSASLNGRALANTGQVTLDTNAITVPSAGTYMSTDTIMLHYSVNFP